MHTLRLTHDDRRARWNCCACARARARACVCLCLCLCLCLCVCVCVCVCVHARTRMPKCAQPVSRSASNPTQTKAGHSTGRSSARKTVKCCHHTPGASQAQSTHAPVRATLIAKRLAATIDHNHDTVVKFMPVLEQQTQQQQQQQQQQHQHQHRNVPVVLANKQYAKYVRQHTIPVVLEHDTLHNLLVYKQMAPFRPTNSTQNTCVNTPYRYMYMYYLSMIRYTTYYWCTNKWPPKRVTVYGRLKWHPSPRSHRIDPDRSIDRSVPCSYAPVFFCRRVSVSGETLSAPQLRSPRPQQALIGTVAGHFLFQRCIVARRELAVTDSASSTRPCGAAPGTAVGRIER